MKTLNPTLWRTCRVLAGKTRIKLLRQLHDHPGQNVSELAMSVGIGRSDASQELRRLQSRGLLQAEQNGSHLLYRMAADPQVLSATPLLKALKAAFASYPPERDEEICSIATGLAYPRRIALAKALLETPQTELALQISLNLSSFATFTHLRILMNSGFVRRDKHLLRFEPLAHPLAGELVRLCRTC